MTANLSTAQKRVLNLIQTRPGLILDRAVLGSRVDLFDDNDPQWCGWTTDTVIDGLARLGLFPSIEGTDGTIFADF